MLLIAAILAATPLFAKASTNIFPYDETVPVSYQIALYPEAELRAPLAGRRVVPSFIAGRYCQPSDYTGGFILHVFPDNTAMIEEWVDIGLPKLVAEGQWSINDKDEVMFDWKRKFSASVHSENFFRTQYGVCEKMKMFIVFNDKKLANVLLVSEELIGPQITQFYRRVSEYVDWPKIQNKLAKKEAQP